MQRPDIKWTNLASAQLGLVWILLCICLVNCRPNKGSALTVAVLVAALAAAPARADWRTGLKNTLSRWGRRLLPPKEQQRTSEGEKAKACQTSTSCQHKTPPPKLLEAGPAQDPQLLLPARAQGHTPANPLVKKRKQRRPKSPAAIESHGRAQEARNRAQIEARVARAKKRSEWRIPAAEQAEILRITEFALTVGRLLAYERDLSWFQLTERQQKEIDFWSLPHVSLAKELAQWGIDLGFSPDRMLTDAAEIQSRQVTMKDILTTRYDRSGQRRGRQEHKELFEELSSWGMKHGAATEGRFGIRRLWGSGDPFPEDMRDADSASNHWQHMIALFAPQRDLDRWGVQRSDIVKWFELGNSPGRYKAEQVRGESAIKREIFAGVSRCLQGMRALERVLAHAQSPRLKGMRWLARAAVDAQHPLSVAREYDDLRQGSDEQKVRAVYRLLTDPKKRMVLNRMAGVYYHLQRDVLVARFARANGWSAFPEIISPDRTGGRPFLEFENLHNPRVLADSQLVQEYQQQLPPRGEGRRAAAAALVEELSAGGPAEWVTKEKLTRIAKQWARGQADVPQDKKALITELLLRGERLSVPNSIRLGTEPAPRAPAAVAEKKSRRRRAGTSAHPLPSRRIGHGSKKRGLPPGPRGAQRRQAHRGENRPPWRRPRKRTARTEEKEAAAAVSSPIASAARVLTMQGANGDGKSTALRTMLLNIWLASNGSPITGEGGRLTPIGFGDHMGEFKEDDASEGESLLSAQAGAFVEVRRAAKKKQSALVVLDESFSGGAPIFGPAVEKVALKLLERDTAALVVNVTHNRGLPGALAADREQEASAQVIGLLAALARQDQPATIRQISESTGLAKKAAKKLVRLGVEQGLFAWPDRQRDASVSLTDAGRQKIGDMQRAAPDVSGFAFMQVEDYQLKPGALNIPAVIAGGCEALRGAGWKRRWIAEVAREAYRLYGADLLGRSAGAQQVEIASRPKKDHAQQRQKTQSGKTAAPTLSRVAQQEMMRITKPCSMGFAYEKELAWYNLSYGEVKLLGLPLNGIPKGPQTRSLARLGVYSRMNQYRVLLDAGEVRARQGAVRALLDEAAPDQSSLFDGIKSWWRQYGSNKRTVHRTADEFSAGSLWQRDDLVEHALVVFDAQATWTAKYEAGRRLQPDRDHPLKVEELKSYIIYSTTRLLQAAAALDPLLKGTGSQRLQGLRWIARAVIDPRHPLTLVEEYEVLASTSGTAAQKEQAMRSLLRNRGKRDAVERLLGACEHLENATYLAAVALDHGWKNFAEIRSPDAEGGPVIDLPGIHYPQYLAGRRMVWRYRKELGRSGEAAAELAKRLLEQAADDRAENHDEALEVVVQIDGLYSRFKKDRGQQAKLAQRKSGSRSAVSADQLAELLQQADPERLSVPISVRLGRQGGGAQMMTIQGPNRKGKSTALRVVAWNIYLSLLGLPHTGDAGAVVTPLPLIPQMRVTGKPVLGESRFMAQAKSYLHVYEKLTERGGLALIDEPLGTDRSVFGTAVNVVAAKHLTGDTAGLVMNVTHNRGMANALAGNLLGRARDARRARLVAMLAAIGSRAMTAAEISERTGLATSAVQTLVKMGLGEGLLEAASERGRIAVTAAGRLASAGASASEASSAGAFGFSHVDEFELKPGALREVSRIIGGGCNALRKVGWPEEWVHEVAEEAYRLHGLELTRAAQQVSLP